ncbi:deoxyribodipyrimidine photo-lyase [Dictyobacter vulcani]|uniref:Deoxyribodipyrimidine photo-lyase n=1 Tax=Dictyobacter vulcani TaxID=2607529 RepID=A0A5J4KLC2_9CHLR|nr:deoxyribodipyrimidine photo-lyase [Dictyobacter vulcani]GER88583.1 deoxyribodipyrimidine photo-lyase [Dictyobacter vulcani]
MIDIEHFVQGLDQRQRVQVWHAGTCTEPAQCVLYWMQRAQRGRENHALNTAIILGNILHLPVVTLFVVTDYPLANLRHYTFMLEGLTITAQHLKERGIPLIMRRGAPATEVTQIARELQAAAVVSDMCELRFPLQWRQDVKQQLEVPFICVDTDTIVPMWCHPQQEYAARTIRPKIQHLLPAFLQPLLDVEVQQPLTQPPCDPGEAEKPLRYLDSLQIDTSVRPPQDIHGGYTEAQKSIQRLLKQRLHAYADQRNNPELVGTSELSAYLHFGQISVQQLAWDVEHYTPEETGSAHIDITGGKAAYLEELIIRRELAINFAFHNPHYDSLEGCPTWGRKTLQKHASDPREWIYSLEEFEQARTHDELWNAAQNEMVVTGRMHGYMRMYWAKKILEWSETPEQAFNIAVYLNDKYELDGEMRMDIQVLAGPLVDSMTDPGTNDPSLA